MSFTRALTLIGLIPAHTGKTQVRGPQAVLFGAHPRAYGENDMGLTEDVIGRGSSPRIQGILRYPL